MCSCHGFYDFLFLAFNNGYEINVNLNRLISSINVLFCFHKTRSRFLQAELTVSISYVVGYVPGPGPVVHPLTN
jgi:hypothetical protein